MKPHAVLQIKGYGAWNGGTLTDNSIYEGRGMFFKNGVLVDRHSIEKRIGVRTRVVAPPSIRIGTIALSDLIQSNRLELSRVKIIIGATNVGDDKRDRGPLVKYPLETVKNRLPGVQAFDLYAGCPGYNVAVEVIFVLSQAGFLKAGDISVVIGAENPHRARAFKPNDTANIIFGDDAMATAFETGIEIKTPRNKVTRKAIICKSGDDLIQNMAQGIVDLSETGRVDGIIIDNQIGKLERRVPATAARVQHRIVELVYPDEKERGTFSNFKSALAFYDNRVDSFAYDIMSLSADAGLVKKIGDAYIESGKCKTVATIFLSSDLTAEICLHRGHGIKSQSPRFGIIDTRTRTHGCFAEYIEAVIEGPNNIDIFGRMDGKGVFLYATRSAGQHFSKMLEGSHLSLNDIDLLIEHQANFAIIPITLEQLFDNSGGNLKKVVKDFIANKMIVNIHERGNCSVVCMQRLPYDLDRGALHDDCINGYPINRNLEKLKKARVILYDSVGAGMTRSSFLQCNPSKKN